MIAELIIVVEALSFSPEALDQKEVLCVARNIYHESRSESVEGQIAVAQVVVNRQNSLDKTACEVVYAKHQFSWTTKKPKVNLKDPIEREAFEDAAAIAVDVMTGKSDSVVGDAEYFISKDMKKPAWTKALKFVGVVGKHAFYAKK